MPAAPCHVHAVSRLVRARAADALVLLSSAEGLARWSLGLWHTRELAPGLLEGESLFGGGTGVVSVELDAAHGSIDYAVGRNRRQLVRRIQARVQAGNELGHARGTCVVTLIAWRTADMADERWQQLAAAHEV